MNNIVKQAFDLLLSYGFRIVGKDEDADLGIWMCVEVLVEDAIPEGAHIMTIEEIMRDPPAFKLLFDEIRDLHFNPLFGL